MRKKPATASVLARRTDMRRSSENVSRLVHYPQQRRTRYLLAFLLDYRAQLVSARRQGFERQAAELLDAARRVGGRHGHRELSYAVAVLQEIDQDVGTAPLTRVD